MQILIVEDSRILRETLSRGLRKAGYRVDEADDGGAGLDKLLTYPYDLVILDRMLPGIDGMEILREVRRQGVDVEVLMLTARASVPDRVDGLEAGADDYLVKPFAFDEMLARVRVLIRRRFDDRTEELRVGNLTVDITAQRAFADGNELRLQPREFDVLELLARRREEIVTRTEVMEHVYDHAVELKSNAIDSAVSKIRRALREAGANTGIRAVPRRGYILEPSPHP